MRGRQPRHRQSEVPQPRLLGGMHLWAQTKDDSHG